MAIIDPIKVEGLAEFNRALRKMSTELPKGLRLAHNSAAELIAADARSRVESRTGRARRSVRAKSTRTEGRVTGGGPRVPYYPWLDFGGAVGRHRSVRRPFIKEGRYIYPAWTRRRDEVMDELYRALLQVARDAGLDIAEGSA